MGATLSCRTARSCARSQGGAPSCVAGAEPDLFLDGRCCADQSAAHRLARAGLIATAVPGAPGKSRPARLTAVGVDALGATRWPDAGLQHEPGTRARGSPA